MTTGLKIPPSGVTPESLGATLAGEYQPFSGDTLEFYIDADNGSDETGDGSELKPFATLIPTLRAIPAVPDGARTIHIRGLVPYPDGGAWRWPSRATFQPWDAIPLSATFTLAEKSVTENEKEGTLIRADLSGLGLGAFTDDDDQLVGHIIELGPTPGSGTRAYIVGNSQTGTGPNAGANDTWIRIIKDAFTWSAVTETQFRLLQHDAGFDLPNANQEIRIGDSALIKFKDLIFHGDGSTRWHVQTCASCKLDLCRIVDFLFVTLGNNATMDGSAHIQVSGAGQPGAFRGRSTATLIVAKVMFWDMRAGTGNGAFVASPDVSILLNGTMAFRGAETVNFISPVLDVQNPNRTGAQREAHLWLVPSVALVGAAGDGNFKMNPNGAGLEGAVNASFYGRTAEVYGIEGDAGVCVRIIAGSDLDSASGNNLVTAGGTGTPQDLAGTKIYGSKNAAGREVYPANPAQILQHSTTQALPANIWTRLENDAGGAMDVPAHDFFLNDKLGGSGTDLVEGMGLRVIVCLAFTTTGTHNFDLRLRDTVAGDTIMARGALTLTDEDETFITFTMPRVREAVITNGVEVQIRMGAARTVTGVIFAVEAVGVS